MNGSVKFGEKPGSAASTLASRRDLPVRVRTLCEGLLKRAREWFAPTLEQALADIENTIFQMAERAGNSGEQQQHFEALRSFKESRSLIAPRFLRSIEGSLAAIRRADEPPLRAAGPGSRRAALELVDAAVLEEDLALREVAARAEMRSSQPLHAFAHRFAVIAAISPDHEPMPLGPVALGEAMRSALGGIDLGLEYRVLAYRQFDRFALAELARFYDSLNQWLCGEGILPTLKLGFRAPGSGAAGEAEAESAAKKAAKPVDAAKGEGAPADQAAPAEPGAPAMPPAPQGIAAQARAAAGLPPTTQAAAEAPQFSTLRNLLAARRRVQGPTAATPTARLPSIAKDDLQQLLGAMQRDAAAGGGRRYDAERFRNTLAVKLRSAGERGSAVGLAGEDQDTVELINMLFDYVTRNIREDSMARPLVGQLHVPVLRAALTDKTFFTRRDHPARELINTIAETSERWLDDADADPELAEKMRMVVDQVSSSFNGDPAVFESMAHDLDQHLKLLMRRADATERRHVEAAKGRDRLELARETARAAVTGLLKNRSPSPRLRTLLEETWTDALALSALRGGASSAEFMQCLDVAAELVARGMRPLGGSVEDTKLRREAATHLAAVGLHEDEVNGLLDNLFAEAPTDAALAQLERIDKALQEKPRLGGETAKRPEKPATPLSAAEQKMLDQIMRTAFGTWFEFTKNTQGETVRRKLAWFSPMTGNCLFVNQRGARIEDLTLELLAREMACGRARVAPVERGRFVDRAWKAIVDLLRPRGSALPIGEVTA